MEGLNGRNRHLRLNGGAFNAIILIRKTDKGGALMSDTVRFVEFMMDAGVLTFGDFVTKSGRRTPYFINTGNYKTGAQISRLGDFYADAIVESGVAFDALYGPAYKGIPLVAAAASSLYRKHGRDVPYCFNRKEAKDHGEGGLIVGYQPKDGDTLVIVEDVVTAGTAVRETLALLEKVAEVRIAALFVSVDRMERGRGQLSALEELRQEHGIQVFPIVTVRDIIAALPAGDPRAERMARYLAEYGVP